jgi:hypothetical protein
VFPFHSTIRRLGFLLLIVPVLAACAARPVPAVVTSSLPPVHPAYPVQISANGRYLVDQDNQPVFWSGDAGWSLIVQATTADVDFYLANRQQKGVTVVLVNLIDHMFGGRAPRAINGDSPFSGVPFSTPNEAYFAHADYVISAAAERGIAVLLDPLYLGYNCGSEGWCAEVQAESTSVLELWGEYLGNRYKSFLNIVWVVGGDVDPRITPGVPDKVTAFAQALLRTDSVHLVTAHNVRGEMAASPWSGAEWLSLNNTYSTYETTYQQAQSAYDLSPARPFFQIEGYYENEHSMTTQQLRAQAYWTLLSGGMGYIFGNCPVWGLGPPAASFCPTANSDWKAELDYPGALSMIHVAELFRPRAWQNLVPDRDHLTLTAGYGTFGNTDYATAEKTPDGSLVVAYLPTIRTVSVDMTTLTGAVSARWYDPSTGTYTSIAGIPFANTGTQQFTPPGNNSAGDGDWVLVLETS